jgi:hypothetical protein
VIWTNDSLASDWVISEAEHARVQGKVIPLRSPTSRRRFHTGFADDRPATLASATRHAREPSTCPTSHEDVATRLNTPSL